MAFYETVFIARPDLSPAQVEALATQYTDIISQGGGEVAKTEFCGLRNLAYKINKNKKGHYVLFNIAGPAAAVHEMERQMRLSEDVMRYMTINVEELDSNPSALMQSRQTRERRHDNRFEVDSVSSEGDDE